ncbi:hypothetical protein SAMN02745194_03406 [Roseomonas rosea]|uniref:Uncharacterized protein n=1 Tax=Muricoccus roseus TaxID=198092 RepID=A0A1M6MAV8_9PROT|nr:hypothetical protein [Roseomonas rosea]SHJ80443.1 hypothetical protein SAMN02745194_03406 [Roseomonas rosea]
MDLDAEELFVIAALRAWVAPLQAPGAPHPDWREIMRLAIAPAAAATAFDMLMTIIAHGARRSLDVRSPPCPSLGEAEVGLLALVAALQAGGTAAATEVLRDWLWDEAVPGALRAAEHFAALTAEAGLQLPSPDLVAGAGRRGHAPRPTLH